MPQARHGPRPWLTLAAASGALGLSVLDETIVGAALPTIRSELDLSAAAAHWVVNAYLLTLACLVAIGGRLGDVLGHRRLFVLGAAVFACASVVAALSGNGSFLIGARALQGVGTALMFPAALAMVTRAYPPERRGVAFGVQTTVAAVFMAGGPFLGGLLTEALNWRWIFWINPLPVLVLVVAAIVAGEPEETENAAAAPGSAGPLDLPGVATLTVGLTALVVALMQSDDWGWTAFGTQTLLALGIVSLVAFFRVEARVAAPIFQLGLFRARAFNGGNLVFFVFQASKMITFVFVVQYLQAVPGLPPVAAGAMVATAILPTLVTSVLAGHAADRFGSRLPLLAGLVLNGGALILAGIVMQQGDYKAIAWILPAWGATLPFLAVTSRRALMSAAPAELRGQAGGANLTIQMLGGTMGIALASTLLASGGGYGTLFIATGAVTLGTVAGAWSLIR
ncbi:MFS transporter [Thalassobaculum fulvum]|uniref:MFS transporter n=1 Tax=Thalassobaculum fulvum TaxID=1633335 RepID=A0A918XRN4_9PROT|nr:MFS transporter [Thalassobaculum fulvum]GHD49069.1 MFS transporter [Thalassobaculum fulvum]